MLVPLAAFVAACGGMLVAGGALGWLHSMQVFSAGDYDLPILISIPSMLLLLILIAAACVVVRAFLDGQQARLDVYLIALALAGTPAAFTRADPGHMLINTLPAIAIATLALLRSGRFTQNLAIAGWAVYLEVAVSLHFFPLVSELRAPVQTPFVVMARRAVVDLRAELPAGTFVLAPFGISTSFDVLANQPVRTGQFDGYGTMGQRLTGMKEAELAAAPRTMLMVPVDYSANCEPQSQEASHFMLHTVFGYNNHPSYRNGRAVPGPLCQYIAEHYVSDANPAHAEHGYLLMHRRPDE